MEYILITGGSRGIGRAISIALSSVGYRVLINYNTDLESAQKTKQLILDRKGVADVLKFDVSNYDETTNTIKEWKKSNKDALIIGLVCSAGIVRDNLLAVMPADDWNNVIDVNLTGTFNTIKAVLPYMIKNKYGRIINISSVVGLTGSFGQTNYSASKAGVIALTRSLALEVAHKNITVNCITPGYIKTEMLNGLNTDDILTKIPLKRLGTPEEVAKAVLYFIDKDSSYTTGAVLTVDGGAHI